MKRLFLMGVLTLVVLPLVIISHAEAFGLKSRIIGKWIEVNGSERIEFLKDGTVILGSSAGDYKLIADNRLRIDIKGGRAIVLEVSFDKEGALILKGHTGGHSKYLTEKAYPAYITQKKAKEEAKRKAEDERKRKSEIERIKKLQANFVFSDLTVLDKNTKLMWTRDANLASRDMKRYEAFEFVKRLNKQKYAGYSDWRVPAIEELETLINFAKNQGYRETGKMLNEIGFRVGNVWYWSSSVKEDREFLIEFSGRYGISNNYGARGTYLVWPVRGGQKVTVEEEKRKAAEERIKAFVVSDLTVIDKLNEVKLMWARDGNIAGRKMDWSDTSKFIKKLNEQRYAGYSDWRLPTKEELESLVNIAKSQGYRKDLDEFFNKVGFKNVQKEDYWSSTELDEDHFAWGVDMHNGSVPDKLYKYQGYGNFVWPVRDGQ